LKILLLGADEGETCPGIEVFDVLLMAGFEVTMETEVINRALFYLCVFESMWRRRIIPVRVLLEVLHLYHCIYVSVCLFINGVKKHRFVPILALAQDPESHKVRGGVFSWLKLIKIDGIILEPNAVIFFQN
jgi:hypothetical protein